MIGWSDENERLSQQWPLNSEAQPVWVWSVNHPKRATSSQQWPLKSEAQPVWVWSVNHPKRATSAIFPWLDLQENLYWYAMGDTLCTQPIHSPRSWKKCKSLTVKASTWSISNQPTHHSSWIKCEASMISNQPNHEKVWCLTINNLIWSTT